MDLKSIGAALLLIVVAGAFVLMQGDNLDRLIYKVALSTDSPGLCQYVASENAMDDCYSFLYDKIDEGVCFAAGRQRSKDGCIINVAIAQYNGTLCPAIANSTIREYCMLIFDRTSADPLTCDKYNESTNRGYCYLSIAYNTNNSAFCDRILPDKILTDAICYESIATATNNSTLCQKIRDEKRRDECLEKVARQT